MEGPSPRLLASLVRAVAMLALPASHQIAWLESLGVGGSADELALEFDDGYVLAPQFVERQWLDAAVVDPLRALNDLLQSMSGPGNAELWDAAALESSPRWSEVREQ